MKTLEEARTYLASVPRFTNHYGLVADPGSKHEELYKFKETIDLSGRDVVFLETYPEKLLTEDPDCRKTNPVTWSIRYPGFGYAHLNLAEVDMPEHIGTWAEFGFENEPFWNGNDPYDCTWPQIVAIIAALPEEHRNRYLELATRSAELSGHLAEAGFKVASAKP